MILGEGKSTVELIACDKEGLARGEYVGNFDMAPLPNRHAGKKITYEG
jgi:hypothetical protein